VKNSKKKVEQAEAEKGELILEVGEMRPSMFSSLFFVHVLVGLF